MVCWWILVLIAAISWSRKSKSQPISPRCVEPRLCKPYYSDVISPSKSDSEVGKFAFTNHSGRLVFESPRPYDPNTCYTTI